MGSVDSSLEDGVDTPLAPDGPLRIAIRSPRRLLRDTLATCLSGRPDLEVVGHVGTIEDLIALCALCAPDVVLLGLSEEAPPRWLEAVRECSEHACLVLLYETLSPDDLIDARQAGAQVMLPCSHGLDALMSVLDRCADRVAGQDRSPAPGTLTEAEREILTLLGAGHTVRHIAGLLRTTANEVENAKRRVYQRLEVSTGCQAVARAVALGLIEHHPPAEADQTPSVDGAPLSSSGVPRDRRCSRW